MNWTTLQRWFLVVGCLSFTACAVVSETGPSGDDGESETTWGGGKGDIYGDDDRRDYYEERDVLMREVARSTAMIMRQRFVAPAEEEGYSRLGGVTFGQKRNLCESEPFREQPAPGHCTGFLVGPDVLATAGHCVRDQGDCKTLKFAFGFYYDTPDRDVTLLRDADIYSCDSYLAREHDSRGADWALVRLDRVVEDRTPLTYRTEGEIADGTGVAIIGHPSGLPMKLAGGGEVFDVAPATYFRSYLDTYGGNSGSPVMNFVTGMIEGVHVRGTSDFVETEAACFVSKVCPVESFGESGCTGNHATRSTVFAPFVPPSRLSPGWIFADQWEVDVIEVGEGERDLLSAVEVAGLETGAEETVEFVLLSMEIDHEEPEKLRLFLENDAMGILEITSSVQGVDGLKRTLAIPDFNGGAVAGQWRLRIVVPAGVALPELHFWGLGIHKS